MIKLMIKGFAYDVSGSPIILLTDEEEEKVLPLWIGMLEAHSIALAVEGTELPRPMTHDLILNICKQFNAAISEIIITDLRDNTFYASIYISTETATIPMDARPSDAIALAIRSSAPIYLKNELADNMLSISELIDEETRKEIDKIFNMKDFKKSLH
ncbi:hypothetical protein DCCM_4119 [Desulfocucumis palustris]|uniref:BFN domain-containing protein n=1 Tax=Desulfocucumis palustris TaxID=1898651 RepID=A0A2L2XFH7_9FIRM|nr:bifunctional nuclease family protein [Desulfocucumis palustris]GBF34998.1 hypothetical protein DCCM_4119 [Desulfocucumis palustris]